MPAARGERAASTLHHKISSSSVVWWTLGRLYDQGKYAEATSVAERSLALTESRHGPDHPDVGASLNNLALLHRLQGRYGEAEPLYQRARSIQEKTPGSAQQGRRQ